MKEIADIIYTVLVKHETEYAAKTGNQAKQHASWNLSPLLHAAAGRKPCSTATHCMQS